MTIFLTHLNAISVGLALWRSIIEKQSIRLLNLNLIHFYLTRITKLTWKALFLNYTLNN